MATKLKFFSSCLLIVVIFSRLRTCNGQNCEEDIGLDLKAYKSPVVLEGKFGEISESGRPAKVSRVIRGSKKLKNKNIQLTGFGLQEACIMDITSFDEEKAYIIFLDDINSEDFYPISANPVEFDKSKRKAVTKAIKTGKPPEVKKHLRPRKLQENDELLLKCVFTGIPVPKVFWTKDSQRIEHNSINGLRIKSNKRQSRLRIKSVKKSLHEGTYTCLVDNTVDPPVNTSSTLEICALSCVNGTLKVKTCQCKCNSGWTGEECDQPEHLSCDISCGSHSEKDPDACRCRCQEGWGGRKCNKCTRDCGSNGLLDSERCECNCNEGYSYVNSTCVTNPPRITCNQTCDHGTLDQEACTCSCDMNYTGQNCSVDIEELCAEDAYCKNGGQCIHKRNQPITCSCPDGITGPTCEEDLCELDCQNGGRLDRYHCKCNCTTSYTGTQCEILPDHETHSCPPKYIGYCLNGGTCKMLKSQHYCICPTEYKGSNRCRHILADDVDTEIAKDDIKPPHPYDYLNYDVTLMVRSIQANSKKMIICMAIICVSLILIMALLVFVYVKNKSAKEKERREREQLKLRKATSLLPARPNTFKLSGAARTGSLELTQLKPARHQSDGNLGSPQRTFHSNSVDGRIGNLALAHSGSATVPRGATPNGHAHKVSQASIHSARSHGSHHSLSSLRSGDSASHKTRKNGYEAVPTQEADQPISKADSGEGLPRLMQDERQRLEDVQQHDETDTESEGSILNGDVEGDRVDDLNPQIEALHSHPGLTEADLETDAYSSMGEYSSSDYVAKRYGMDSSPVQKSPHRTRPHVPHGSPRHMSIHDNPLEVTYPHSRLPKSHAIDIQNEDGHYVNRLRDVVENSPPSAV